MIKKLPNQILLLIICLIPLNTIFLNYLFTIKSFTAITGLTNGLITPTLIAGIFTIFVFLLISTVVGKLRLKDFLLTSKKIKKGVFWTLILWIFLNLLSAIFSYLENGYLVLNDKLSYRFGGLIAQFLGNAFAEELIYRGILLIQIYLILRVKINNKKSILLGLLISQSIFSLSHIPNRIFLGQMDYLIFDLIKLFIVGIILSLIFIKTQNLIYLIGVHSLLNQPFSLFKTEEVFPILSALILSIIITIFWNKINRYNGTDWFKKGLISP